MATQQPTDNSDLTLQQFTDRTTVTSPSCDPDHVGCGSDTDLSDSNLSDSGHVECSSDSDSKLSDSNHVGCSSGNQSRDSKPDPAAGPDSDSLTPDDTLSETDPPHLMLGEERLKKVTVGSASCEDAATGSGNIAIATATSLQETWAPVSLPECSAFCVNISSAAASQTSTTSSEGRFMLPANVNSAALERSCRFSDSRASAMVSEDCGMSPVVVSSDVTERSFRLADPQTSTADSDHVALPARVTSPTASEKSFRFSDLDIQTSATTSEDCVMPPACLGSAAVSEKPGTLLDTLTSATGPEDSVTSSANTSSSDVSERSSRAFDWQPSAIAPEECDMQPACACSADVNVGNAGDAWKKQEVNHDRPSLPDIRARQQEVGRQRTAGPLQQQPHVGLERVLDVDLRRARLQREELRRSRCCLCCWEGRPEVWMVPCDHHILCCRCFFDSYLLHPMLDGRCPVCRRPYTSLRFSPAMIQRLRRHSRREYDSDNRPASKEND